MFSDLLFGDKFIEKNNEKFSKNFLVLIFKWIFELYELKKNELNEGGYIFLFKDEFSSYNIKFLINLALNPWIKRSLYILSLFWLKSYKFLKEIFNDSIILGKILDSS